MNNQLPPGIDQVAAIEQQIIDLEQQYTQAVSDRVNISMTDKSLLEAVRLLRADILELKKTRLDLIRMNKKVADDLRAAAYQSEKAQQAHDLKARGIARNRYDEALESLVRKYFDLEPGSFCTSHVNNTVARIRNKIINEARGQK